MADSSSNTAPILNLIAGDRWARRQLCGSINNVSVPSRLMKSLTLVGVAFIDSLALLELNVRRLHNHTSDPGPDYGRLLGSTPAAQRYKVHPEEPILHRATIEFQEVGLLGGAGGLAQAWM